MIELKHGMQKKLAEAAGVTTSTINEIIKGKRYCPSSLAVKLEDISEEICGKKITAREWILSGLGV